MKQKKNRVAKTLKAINDFLKSVYKSYNSMKSKLSKIWCILALIIICASCNVTRVVTTQSECYQKGDTAVTIMTKTTETYNAQKNY